MDTAMNRFLFPILGLLLACSGATEPDTGDTEPEYRDIDGDGYNERVDCDDYNSSVNPGQPEICDGIDNNCDNLIDGTDSIDIITWYVDIDADGFGDENAEPVEACDQPDGYVCALTNGDDPCDDRCDNDRDGLMDQDDPDCTEDSSADGSTAGERRSWDENGDNEPDFDCNDEDYMVHPGTRKVVQTPGTMTATTFQTHKRKMPSMASFTSTRTWMVLVMMKTSSPCANNLKTAY